MNKTCVLAVTAALLAGLLGPATAASQELLFHFPMDDTASSGDAVVYKRSAGSGPVPVAGKIGSALHFEGAATLALPFNLDHAQYPQITVTAWVREGDGESGTRTIFSSGSSAGIRLGINGGRLAVKAGRTGVSYDAKFPRNEWVFVAAVVDTAGGWARLYQNDGSYLRKAIDTQTAPPTAFRNPANPSAEMEPYVFVGANEFRTWAGASRGLSIDDVRVYNGALDESQIEAIRTSAQLTATRPEDPDFDPARQPDATIGQVPDDIQNPDLAPPASAPDLLRDGPLLDDPRPLDDGTTTPGFTVPGGPSTTIDVPDAPPPPEPANEIICEGTTGAEPTVWRKGPFPSAFVSAVGQARDCGLRVTVATINASDQWIVATPDQIAFSLNAPEDLATTLREFEAAHGGLSAADIDANGAWLIVSGREVAHQRLSTAAASRIDRIVNGNSELISFDFHPTRSDTWAAVTADGGVFEQGMNNAFVLAQPNWAMSQRKVHHVRLFDDGWLLLGTDYWFASSGVDNATLDVLRTHQRSGRRLDQFVFGTGSDEYVTYSVGPEPERPADPLYTIEHSTGGGTIWSRMREHNLVAVSIAMVRENSIAWARAYGLRNADEPESYVDIETTFDAASISKPIAAFGLLQLVQDGKLSLTEEGVLEDIEQLFDSDKTSLYRSAVDPATGNLIQLLQHCVSICYAGFGDCAGGAKEYDLALSIPTTAEMILGENRGDFSHRLSRGNDSGTQSDYTSANFMLVQALIDVHGDGFLNHMTGLLSDLGMDKATYMSPYPQRSLNFARGWDGSQVTEMVGYGEMAAASMVSRPIDVARFVIAVNQLAEDPSAVEPLSNENTLRFIGRDNSVYSSSEYSVCGNPNFGSDTWGLGVRRGTGWSGNRYFTHGGIHNGYRTRMVGLHDIGSGIVVFMTGDERTPDGDPETSDPLKADEFFGELRSAVLSAYPF